MKVKKTEIKKKHSKYFFLKIRYIRIEKKDINAVCLKDHAKYKIIDKIIILKIDKLFAFLRKK